MLKAILLLSLVALAVCIPKPGGYVDRGENEEDVLVAANYATKTLSKKFVSPYHHKLDKVIKAESQVVAGTNYRLTILLGKTNCKKDEVQFDDAVSCDYQDSISTYKKCVVVVWEKLDGEHELTASGCIVDIKKDHTIKM